MIKTPFFLKLSVLILLVGGGSWSIYKTFFAPKKPELFKTALPEKRTITQTVKATGYIEPEDVMKIGSIVTGIIYKLYVEENDLVKKGQLLAEIDDGKDDTLVRAAQGELDAAQAKLTYAENYLQRQKVLFEAGHISKNLYEEVSSDYQVALATAATKKANYDQALLLFNRKKITAPEDGLVITQNSSEGETVAITSPATIIYTIAKDIRKMEVNLEIDESTVSDLKVGMTANLSFEAYPHRTFKGKIYSINNSPTKKGSAVNYTAAISIDNSHRLFRPGMSVDATITVAEKENVIAIPSNLFRVSNGALEQIAKVVGYEYKPLSKQERIQTLETDSMKTIWVVRNKAFIEQPITIGINDNSYYEIVSGLQENDLILTDLAEPDAMKEFFKKFFGKGLG
jgi:HlyD family secretion protein